MPVSNDEQFMQAALREAEKGVGTTSPNPAVGAIAVVGGKIIGKGHHRLAGGAHAEIECLAQLPPAVAERVTLYVTLEPCSTSGRTPPCTDAIIASGIRSVVIGATDPNPLHSGRGIELLREARIAVCSGVLEQQCAELNRAFNKWIQTRTPFVIAKCGMSLDGRLTAGPGESRWITSPAARRHANSRRARVDAILVGAETVRVDNPRLTVRDGKRTRQPRRVILSRSGALSRTAHVFSDRDAERTLVFRNDSLADVLAELGRREITSVLIEGGGAVLAQALDERLIDSVEIYLGSVLTGGPVLAFGGKGAAAIADALRLSRVRYEQVGRELFLCGDTLPAVAEAE